MDVKEVLLPGVGLRYEFDIRDGDRVGVIARRSGGFEVVIYARNDPDEARPLFRLTEEEAERDADEASLIVKPKRDFQALHRELTERGLLVLSRSGAIAATRKAGRSCAHCDQKYAGSWAKGRASGQIPFTFRSPSTDPDS